VEVPEFEVRLSIFALRLKQARNRRGMTQVELGRQAGLDESVASPRINQYEKGVHEPQYTTAMRLAKVLGIPAPFLYCEDEELAELLLLWSSMSPAERTELLKEAARSGP
jgi:transcriptional regulator with XRE-family HTH domain